MDKRKLALLDDYQNVAPGLLNAAGLGDEVEIHAFNDHLDDERAVAERLHPYEIICLMRERTPFPRTLFEALPNLRLLVTSGMRNASVDVKAARARKVVVCGTPSAGAPTAELAWGLIIACLRHIPEEDRAMRAGAWQRTVGVGLGGKTLGVAGLGKLGSRVARVGLTFDMNVIAWSQNLTRERCDAAGVSLVTKEELLRQSDVMTLHLVLSERTRALFGAAELAMMKRTAILVNTSRGPIVEERALVDALQRKTIAGAGLDVFDREPLPAGHPLLSCDNVVLTPHLGYVEEENYRAYFGGYAAAVRGYLAGAPVNVIE